jgi:hypothetical protein
MSDWQQTRDISMAVQTLDLHMDGADLQPSFHASCNLINIARGRGQVTITPNKDAMVISGSVNILINKPVMEVTLVMPQSRFDDVLRLARGSSQRPLVLSLTVDQDLAVSVAGDLRINEAMTLGITDCHLTIPLK